MSKSWIHYYSRETRNQCKDYKLPFLERANYCDWEDAEETRWQCFCDRPKNPGKNLSAEEKLDKIESVMKLFTLENQENYIDILVDIYEILYGSQNE